MFLLSGYDALNVSQQFFNHVGVPWCSSKQRLKCLVRLQKETPHPQVEHSTTKLLHSSRRETA